MKASITCSSSASAIWPWPTAMRASRHQLLDQARERVDRLHAVVHEVHLAAARQLLLDGGARSSRSRTSRPMVWIARRSLRRRLDHRHVAEPGQRHLQRARDRAWPSASARRRWSCSCLSRSLCRTPKRCSSSTTSRPRSRELDVLGQQAVGADQRCRPCPSASSASTALISFGGAEAGDHLDAHREGREALAEGLAVLEREHRGGRQHRHLLAVAAPP